MLPGDDDEPLDLVAAQERIATAADLMAQLDPFEQQVMAVMAAGSASVGHPPVDIRARDLT